MLLNRPAKMAVYNDALDFRKLVKKIQPLKQAIIDVLLY